MSFDADPRPGGSSGSSTGSSTSSLLSDALNQVTRLVRGEVQLAKAEVAQNLRNAALGVGLLAAAAVLALVGLIVLAGALVGALAAWVGPGWAALIVGALILLVAVLLALRGLNSLKPENLAPSRTVKNVQADAQTIKENVSK